jgi:hypothetical protein
MIIKNGFTRLICGIVLIIQGILMLVISQELRQFLTIESLVFIFLGGLFFTRIILISLIFTFLGVIIILVQNFGDSFPIINTIYKWMAVISIISGVVLALLLSKKD